MSLLFGSRLGWWAWWTRALVCSALALSSALGACTREQKPVAPGEPAPSAADVTAFNEERQRLIAKNELDAADRICQSWIERRNVLAQAEGYKCSANVFVSRAQDAGDPEMVSTARQRLAVGATAAEPRFSGPAIEQAIDQLDQAAALNPADLSIHQGRLFLVLGSGDYARAAVCLDASLRGLPNAPASTWLAYLNSFPRARASEAVEFARLLAEHYPQEADAHVALGAWLDVTGNEKEAREHLQQALKLDPNNAMAHWRLGEVLEQFNDAEAARKEYRLSAKRDGELAEERRSELAQRTGDVVEEGDIDALPDED